MQGLRVEAKSEAKGEAKGGEEKETGGGSKQVPETNGLSTTVPLGKPKGVTRASVWTDAVEEQYRLQSAGWRDITEYVAAYDKPDRWISNNFLKCLRVKKNGERALSGRDAGKALPRAHCRTNRLAKKALFALRGAHPHTSYADTSYADTPHVYIPDPPPPPLQATSRTGESGASARTST